MKATKKIVGLLFAVAISLCSAIAIADPAASLQPIYELTDPVKYQAQDVADLTPIYEVCPNMTDAVECDCDCKRGGDCDCGEDCVCEGHKKSELSKKEEVEKTIDEMTSKSRRTQWLMFTADYCNACQTSKEDFAGWLKASGWKIDDTPQAHIRLVEFDKSPELAREYAITKLPTFVLVHDGKKIDRAEAYPGRENLAKRYVAAASSQPVSALATDGAAHTPMAEVIRVLNLLPKPEVGFVDFGCGYDARWCVAAAEKWQCRVTGIENDPARAAAARERVRNLGLDHLITIIEGDVLTADVQGDVAVAYLYPDLLAQLKPRLETFKAVASYMHAVPGLPMQKNGDSWFYLKSQPAQFFQTGQRQAVWGGMAYSGRVCNSPNCQMCNTIQRQLGL